MVWHLVQAGPNRLWCGSLWQSVQLWNGMSRNLATGTLGDGPWQAVQTTVAWAPVRGKRVWPWKVRWEIFFQPSVSWHLVQLCPKRSWCGSL